MRGSLSFRLQTSFSAPQTVLSLSVSLISWGTHDFLAFRVGTCIPAASYCECRALIFCMILTPFFSIFQESLVRPLAKNQKMESSLKYPFFIRGYA